MLIEFEIKGKVKAKQSFKIGRNGFKYISPDVVEYSNFVKLSFISKYPDWNIEALKDKPLKMNIDVFMLIPASYSKEKKTKALENKLRPIVKPDCDNIAKNINDSLNGILYPDDKQIVSLTVNKFYSDSEYVKVTLKD